MTEQVNVWVLAPGKPSASVRVFGNKGHALAAIYEAGWADHELTEHRVTIASPSTRRKAAQRLRREQGAREREANRVDGFDRDDLGLSPDY